MASKAKTIGLEERAGLVHSTREQEIRIRATRFICNAGDSLAMN